MMDDFKTACDALDTMVTHRNLTHAGVPIQRNGETMSLWARVELYRQMASTHIETKTREVA